MIRIPPSIFVASAPIDLRLSFDRLGGIVRTALGREPQGDVAFVFHNRACTHVKILWHDGGGYCVLYKRLDRRTFRLPMVVPAGAASVTIHARELALLFQGIDTALLRRARRIARENDPM